MRKTMKSLLIAAVAVVVTVTAGPASAVIDPGVKAPNFAGKDFVNTSSVDLQTLAGRVVLLEIFRTW